MNDLSGVVVLDQKEALVRETLTRYKSLYCRIMGFKKTHVFSEAELDKAELAVQNYLQERRNWHGPT